MSIKLGIIIAIALVLVSGLAVQGADSTPAKTEVANAGATDTSAIKVSLEAKGEALTDLLGSLAKQSKKKLVIESTVKGKLDSFSVKDVTLESALTALCKAGKCDWRKVYIARDSKLVDQPDKMAATVRLLSGMAFPDVVIAGASNGKVAAHYVDAKTVEAVQGIGVKEERMTEVYLITNDDAVAEKAKDDDKKSGSDAVDDYVKAQRDSMDKFTKMTPEEQEAALVGSVELIQQMPPDYMAKVMSAMMRMGPDAFERFQKPQTDMLFSMSSADRRQLMKWQMSMMSRITPEQRKILEEDAKAMMEEMKNDLSAPAP